MDEKAIQQQLADDAWSYTNSSCGTSCETSDNPSSESSYEVKEANEDAEEKEASDNRTAKKVGQRKFTFLFLVI